VTALSPVSLCVQIDKSTADFLRDKDLELMQTRRNAEEQLRKLTVSQHWRLHVRIHSVEEGFTGV
jgi:hypothetical protein